MKNKTKNRVLTAALILVCAVPFASAYFTDHKEVDNIFTYGNVEMTFEEPGWAEPESVLPNQTLKKDPTITNTGNNPAFAFVEVSVPYANITVASEDGSKAASRKDTELFTYTVNQGWTEIGTGTKDPEAKTVTHLYVYGTSEVCTELYEEESVTLYDSVTFVNAVEDEGLEGQTDILTNKAYVIQTTDINGGVTTPDAVWDVLSKQSM